jgi:hypothetical protein
MLRFADEAHVANDQAVEGAGDCKSADDLLAALPQAARDEADALLADPVLTKRVIDDVARQGVAGERELVLTIYLVGVSRLLRHPLAAIVQGPSASGKSYLIEKVASLFPPEALIRATQMTPQALFHMPAGRLRHRFVVAGERSRVEDDDRAEATRALRGMLSAGKLTKLMPMKVNGTIETVPIEQEGPIAFIESTTLSKVFEEDATRCLMLHTDERPKQTRLIVARVAAAHSGDSGLASTERVVLRHFALQRMLRPYAVVIPYADRVGALFTSDRVEARRAFPQMLVMIQASAILHQRQRKKIGDGSLLATLEDYQLAHHLLSKPLGRQLGGGLSDPASRFFNRMKQWTGADAFTTTEAKSRETSSKSAVHAWLAELYEAGVIEQTEPPRGRSAARWRLISESPHPTGTALPAVERVFPEVAGKRGHKPETSGTP